MLNPAYDVNSKHAPRNLIPHFRNKRPPEIKQDGNYLRVPGTTSAYLTLACDSVSNSTWWQKWYYLDPPYPHITVPFRNSAKRLLSVTNFTGTRRGKGEGERRKASTRSDKANRGIRNFYMYPDEIDFRICQQRLPFVAASSPLPFPHFLNYHVPRHSGKRIKVLRGRRGRRGGGEGSMCSLYKVEVRNNDVLGRSRRGASSGSTLWKTSKQRPEILRFRSHSSTSCSTPGER